jgi:hypothetical protein
MQDGEKTHYNKCMYERCTPVFLKRSGHPLFILSQWEEFPYGKGETSGTI